MCQFYEQPSSSTACQSLQVLMDWLLVLAYNRPATLCVKGNCNHPIYCASCTKDKRIDHRHKDSLYAVKVIRKKNLPVSPCSPVQCAKCQTSKSPQPAYLVQDSFVEDILSSLSFLKDCRLTWLFLECFKTHFVGLFCNHCKYFAICWGCICAIHKGPSFELISGLLHQTTAGSSNTCTASDWLLIYEPVPGVIRS